MATTNWTGYTSAYGSMAGGISGFATGIINAQSQKHLYQMKVDAYKHDAKMAKIRKDQMQNIIDSEVASYMEKVGGLIGTQKVNLATQNVKIEKGAAGRDSVSQQIERDTRHSAASEVDRMRANAANAMLGVDQEIMNAGLKARFASAESSFQQSQSILAGSASLGMGFLEGGYKAAKIDGIG